MHPRPARVARALVLSFLACVVPAARATLADDALAPDLRAAIDKAAAEVLAHTGAPSASIAVVEDGRIAYVKAYGTAHAEAKTPATPAMRYSVGSISKQFTAAAILLLAEEGKVSLDDPVARFVPDVTRAGDVTLRQILSMTSGYQDYWPQDYVMPNMLRPASAQDILDGWAKKPLDFEPGTRWQYSNTNYVIAGLVVEKAAGMPLLDFLRLRVFGPLHMTTVTDTDQAPLGPTDPARYTRYALGPLRPAPKEGKGWLFAAGELAMTAEDLARWDVSMIEQSVLKPESYRQLQTEVRLANGAGTRYGLGVDVSLNDARRLIAHGGEVSGFTAANQVFPDDRVAVVVLTNIDAASTSGEIATRVARLMFAPTGSDAAGALAQARQIFEGLQKGKIDRGLFTANANAYFSSQAVADFASSLGRLGRPREFTAAAQRLRGGMTFRRYTIRFKEKTLGLTTFTMPDGKLEQYQVAVDR